MAIYIITVRDLDDLYIVGAYTNYEVAVERYGQTCEMEDENDNYGNEISLIEVVGEKKTTLETYTAEGCEEEKEEDKE